MNTCKKIRPLIPAFHSHMTDPDTAERVRMHLDRCPACTGEFETLSGAWDLLEVVPPGNVPVDLEARFWLKIRGQQEKSFSLRDLFRPVYGIAWILSVVAAAFILSTGPFRKQHDVSLNTPSRQIVTRFARSDKDNSLLNTYLKRSIYQGGLNR